MKKILLLLMLIVSALTLKAQYNVVVYPSETYQYERFYYEYNGYGPHTFENYISTQDQYLYMSFYNRGTSPVELRVVIRDNSDGSVLSHEIIRVETMHSSDRIMSIAPQEISYIGYSWRTEITVMSPIDYDVEAYWIYRYRF